MTLNPDTPAPPASESVPGTGQLHADIVTNMGTMKARLFEAQVPRTVANFVALAMGTVEWTEPPGMQSKSFGDLAGEKKAWTGGSASAEPQKVKRPLYSGSVVHRVIPEFMIQMGCPLGRGTGSPGWRFADEIDSTLRHDKPGVLSMANAGPNTNGSQFFVTEVPTPHLDGRHAVFGELIEGVDIVKAIARVPTGPRDKPVEDVVVEEIRCYRV